MPTPFLSEKSITLHLRGLSCLAATLKSFHQQAFGITAWRRFVYVDSPAGAAAPGQYHRQV